MAQNIYDDAGFFEAYAAMPRSIDGLAAAPEWPELQGMLPPLLGRRVVDLGCGYGWFCRWAASQGAAAVLGIDLSERMLARAAELSTLVGAAEADVIEYRRVDLGSVELPVAEFDLAYSSLALHYVGDLTRLFSEVRRSLVDDGSFVFSVEHPIHTAPSAPGFDIDDDGRATWPLDAYLDEGPRHTTWLGTSDVVKHHRTVTSHVHALLDTGFSLQALCEWGPSEVHVAEHPDWAPERARPPFLLVAARCS